MKISTLPVKEKQVEVSLLFSHNPRTYFLMDGVAGIIVLLLILLLEIYNHVISKP